ncbi:S41 family peptidase [Candidatus Neomarinimicrobiota bacterium]
MIYKINIFIKSVGVLLFLFISLSCSELLVENPNLESNDQDFENTWNFINDVYPYFELKGVDWDMIYEKYHPIVTQTQGDKFLSILVDMLGELKDGHTYIKTIGGQKIKTYIPPRRIRDMYSFSPLVVRKYFEKELKVTGIGGIEYGIGLDNIGYIQIGSFGSALNFIESFNVALNHMKSTSSLIIDVRHNTGGDGVNAVYVVSCFLNDPLEGLKTYVLGKLTDQELIQPNTNIQYGGKVVVLTNGVCYSATESFVEIMKQIPTVTVIGDTTGGGSAGYFGYEYPASGNLMLSNGVEIHVGTIDIRRYDDIPFENIGITPDIRVYQCEKDILDGYDIQLETALELLNTNSVIDIL